MASCLSFWERDWGGGGSIIPIMEWLHGGDYSQRQFGANFR